MNAVYQSKRDRSHAGNIRPVDKLPVGGDLAEVSARLRSLEAERDRLEFELALSRPIIADLALNPFASIAELRLKARITLAETVE